FYLHVNSEIARLIEQHAGTCGAGAKSHCRVLKSAVKDEIYDLNHKRGLPDRAEPHTFSNALHCSFRRRVVRFTLPAEINLIPESLRIQAFHTSFIEMLVHRALPL